MHVAGEVTCRIVEHPLDPLVLAGHRDLSHPHVAGREADGFRGQLHVARRLGPQRAVPGGGDRTGWL